MVDNLSFALVLIGSVALDWLSSRDLQRVPPEDREVLNVLLKPLFLSTALFIAAVISEIGASLLSLEGYYPTMTPIFLGFAATLVASLLRRRAYRTYEVAKDRERGHALALRSTWLFVVSTGLWIALAYYRLGFELGDSP